MEGRILGDLLGPGQESAGAARERSRGRDSRGFQEIPAMNGVGHGGLLKN
jgi:hypothetical protein